MSRWVRRSDTGGCIVITGSIHSVRASAVEMARRLADDGHRVEVVTPTGVPRDLERAGVPIHEHEFPEVASSADAGDGLLARITRLPRARQSRRNAVDALVDHDLRELIEARDPDLVVIDVELSATVVNVLSSGRRVALFTTFPGIDRDFSVPPAHSPIIPGQGLGGSRLAIAARWVRFFLGTELKWARAWLAEPADSARSRVRRLARRLGLPRGTVDAHQWIQPVGFPGLPVIEFNLAEFDLPSRERPDRHLVGSMVSTPTTRADAPLDPETEFGVARVAGAREAGQRIVYCSFGSFASSYRVDLLQRVIDAVDSEPSWSLVLGLGGLDEVPPGLAVPDEVIVFGWAPQNRILRLADVAVVHGGHATVYECIEHGVPMAVLPMTLDQPGYGARVQAHGLGVAVDVDATSQESATSPRDKIGRILDESGYSDAAASMAESAHRARSERLLETCVRSLI